MAASDANLPTRLVLCVDGTQYSPPPGGSETNIHRIYAALRQGRCYDSTNGQELNQVVKYVPGIGSADEAFSKDRLQASMLGQGYLKQIQDVYESCCELSGPKDEIWMFGFSRGAFVVRAVAGLVHHFGAVGSAGLSEFAKDFKKVLKDAERSRGSSGSLALSPTASESSAATRPPPKVMFVGAFDTVKALNDDAAFDLSYNRSIRHMRHAVAIHEDRKALAPEYVLPEELYSTNLSEYGRSFIQAHFIGNHTDMGGSSKKGGLGLYPLQWMLFEAKRCGLDIELKGGSADDVRNPLSVVFPRSKAKPKTKPKKGESADTWSCKIANGIVVPMQDLREVHGLIRNNESYAVKLTTRFGSMRQKKSRDPFNKEGMLIGYCDWAPQGTIIHPSVYLLLDEHVNVALETKELKLQRHIEEWRERTLGTEKNGQINTGFWLDDDDEEGGPNVGAIRVLVCGNTGVGKSTLINKIFGVDVTTASNRSRGIHDVREEITFEGRSDLVVHDSGGFEAGADDEFKAIEAFLKEKSTAAAVEDRLHVIWFCIDINSPRTLQTATEKLFLAVSEYANDVPIIVVATKKDDFLDIQFSAQRKAMKKEGKKFDEEECEQFAERQLEDRIETIRNEMQSLPGGRLDACLAISQDDDSSIAELSKTTSHCFDTDKVRLLYIRAQVSRIDLKIDLALCEVMRRYKKLIRSTTGTSYSPFGATINRKVTTLAVTKSIINCFGLPTVSADVAMEALKANVWKTLGANATLALADAFHIVGVLGTVAAGGIPAWLVTGSINATYVVPTTCRLFLIMATDLTFVLARSFKEVTFRASGQPSERDVSAAARNYAFRGYSQHVHHDIKKLVPRRNLVASYKVDAVQRGLETIFTTYKDNLMEDVDLPLKVKGMRIGTGLDDDGSTEAGSIMDADFKRATDALAELEAKTPMVEMDASKPIVELPAEGNVSELDGSGLTKEIEVEDINSTPKRHELPA